MPMNPRAALSRALEGIPPEYAEGVERRLVDLEKPAAEPQWAPFLAPVSRGWLPFIS